MIAIYPGSFDPITNGHTDLITRASKLYDLVIVAIATNHHSSSNKQSSFPVGKRVELARQVLANQKRVEVCQFDGLLVNYAHQRNASVILRGLRAVSDFEYEFQLAGMNRKLAPEIETIFLTPAADYSYLSSSLVREIASLGGDLSSFVSKEVADALISKFQN